MRSAICILLLLMLSACGVSPERRMLAEADAIMEEQPDSAMAILECIDRSALDADSDLPYYALLYTQAQIKNWIEVDSDTLINIAFDRYRDADESNLRMRAYFYKAQIAFNACDFKTSMRHILTAREIAKEDNNPYWIAKSSGIMGDIFLWTYNYPQAKIFTQEAADKYLEAGRTASHRYALSDLARVYYNEKDFERNLAITDSLTLVVENEQPLDSALMAYILEAAVPAWYEYGKYDEINKAFDSYINPLYKDNKTVTDLLIQSYVEFDTDHKDQALHTLQYAFGKSKDEQEYAQILYAIYREAIADSNYYRAATMADSLINYQGKIALNLLTESVSIIQRDFYNEKAEREKSRSKFISFILIATIIVALGFAFLIWYIYRLKIKAQKAELENLISSILLLNNKINNIESENKTLSQALDSKNSTQINSEIVERLFKEKWSTLNMLCNEYFDQSDCDSTHKLILSKIEKELRQLRSPKKLNEIVESVDKYFNGIVTLLREECGFINEDDITFLALIIAGFSVRAVCYLTDIKYKNYYLKKSRLCKRIELSDAVHKELFLTKIKG